MILIGVRKSNFKHHHHTDPKNSSMIFWAIIASSSVSNIISSSASHLCLEYFTFFLSVVSILSKLTWNSQAVRWWWFRCLLHRPQLTQAQCPLCFSFHPCFGLAIPYSGLSLLLWSEHFTISQPSKLIDIPSKCSKSFALSLWRHFSWEEKHGDDKK